MDSFFSNKSKTGEVKKKKKKIKFPFCTTEEIHQGTSREIKPQKDLCEVENVREMGFSSQSIS